MADTNRTAEKAYVKYAWILLFLACLLLLPFAVNFIFVLDPPPERAFWDELIEQHPTLKGVMETTFRLSGIGLLGFSVLGMAISSVSYRKGERWAWYAAWIIPIFWLSVAAIALGGGTSPAPFVIPIIPILGLLLPYSKFFPKRTADLPA